jgi:hypothetical protein
MKTLALLKDNQISFEKYPEIDISHRGKYPWVYLRSVSFKLVPLGIDALQPTFVKLWEQFLDICQCSRRFRSDFLCAGKSVSFRNALRTRKQEKVGRLQVQGFWRMIQSLARMFLTRRADEHARCREEEASCFVPFEKKFMPSVKPRYFSFVMSVRRCM